MLSPSRASLAPRADVLPATDAKPGGSEIAIAVTAESDVDRLHAAWADRAVSIAQAPTEMDFGRTFVAMDPDGHRVRVFAPR